MTSRANSGLDGTDMRILRALQKEPDLTMAALAERVGLSHTPCWRRVRRMEEGGTIRGRALVIDAGHLGLEVTVIAEITLKQHDASTLQAFEEAVQAHPQIVECFSMSGESDYLIQVIVRSIADYENLLKTVLVQIPGVGSIISRFTLKSVKANTALPL